MKKYKLLKSLPGIQQGVIFINHKTACNRWFPENEFENGELKYDIAIYGFLYADILNPEWFEEITIKPPLGITPFNIHCENRFESINCAIQRYNDAGKPVPSEWLKEQDAIKHNFQGKWRLLQVIPLCVLPVFDYKEIFDNFNKRGINDPYMNDGSWDEIYEIMPLPNCSNLAIYRESLINWLKKVYRNPVRLRR